MWQGREYQVCVAQPSIFGPYEGNRATDAPYVLSGTRVRRGEGQLHGGMSRHQLAQLAARVSRGAEYADRNFIHSECINSQSSGRNGSLRRSFQIDAHWSGKLAIPTRK